MPEGLLLNSILRSGVSRRNSEADIAPGEPTVGLRRKMHNDNERRVCASQGFI
jgi:hypothetical protein